MCNALIKEWETKGGNLGRITCICIEQLSLPTPPFIPNIFSEPLAPKLIPDLK